MGNLVLPTVTGCTSFPLHHHCTQNECKEPDHLLLLSLCVCQVDEEPDPISLGVCGVGQPPQGLKRKAETPLGSPPEPGQILQQQDDDGRGAGRFKIRVTHLMTLNGLLATVPLFVLMLSLHEICSVDLH